MGRKLGDEEGGTCVWTGEATTTWEEITRERQMHNTEEKDIPSHLIEYVDMIFFIFRATGQVAGLCVGKAQR